MLAFFFLSASAVAGESYLRILGLNEWRDDIRQRKENPTQGFLDIGHKERKWEAEAHLRVGRDFERKKQGLDLYETNLFGRVLEDRLEIRGGRQFFTPGFNVYLMDGMQADFNLTRQVGFGVYAGIPQTPETDDFQIDTGLISGTRFFWNRISGLTGHLSTLYQQTDFSEKDWIETHRVSVAGYLFFEPVENGNASFYTGSEYQVAGKTLNLLTFGTDFRPHPKWSFNLEGNIFNENRKEIKDTLTAVHADGPITQGRIGARQKLNRDLSLIENVTFSRLKDPARQMSHSHQLETGIDYYLYPLRLDISPRYALIRSYGGMAQRGSLFLARVFAKQVTLRLQNDYVHFTKRTHDNGGGFASLLWGGWHLTREWTLGGKVEFRKNNDVSREFRGGFLLEWGIGKIPAFPRSQKGPLLL